MTHPNRVLRPDTGDGRSLPCTQCGVSTPDAMYIDGMPLCDNCREGIASTDRTPQPPVAHTDSSAAKGDANPESPAASPEPVGSGFGGAVSPCPCGDSCPHLAALVLLYDAVGAPRWAEPDEVADVIRDYAAAHNELLATHLAALRPPDAQLAPPG